MWTREQFDQFIAVVDDPLYKCLFTLMLIHYGANFDVVADLISDTLEQVYKNLRAYLRGRQTSRFIKDFLRGRKINMGKYIFIAIISYIVGSLAYWLPGRLAITAAIAKSKEQQNEQQKRNTAEMFETNVGRIVNEITRLGLDEGKKFAYVEREDYTECLYIHDEEQGKVYIAYNNGGVIAPPSIAPTFFTHTLNVNQLVGCYVDTGHFKTREDSAETAEIDCTTYYALNIQTTDPNRPTICLPLIQKRTRISGKRYSSAAAFATSVQASITDIVNGTETDQNVTVL